MAKANADKKPKRKLRAAPTLREQAEASAAAATEDVKPSRKRRLGSKLLAPLKALGRLLKRIGGRIRRSSFGRGVGKIYRSKPLWPVRFVVKLIAKVLFVSYFREAWKELRLVIWPDRKTTWRLTFAVILFAIVFGALVAALDFGFERLFREVILKA